MLMAYIISATHCIEVVWEIALFALVKGRPLLLQLPWVRRTLLVAICSWGVYYMALFATTQAYLFDHHNDCKESTVNVWRSVEWNAIYVCNIVWVIVMYIFLGIGCTALVTLITLCLTRISDSTNDNRKASSSEQPQPTLPDKSAADLGTVPASIDIKA